MMISYAPWTICWQAAWIFLRNLPCAQYDQIVMNTLAYREIGNRRWPQPLPTFLVDGQDLVDKLLGDRDLGVPGIGAVSADTNTFLFPGTTVFHKIRVGRKCRQVILTIWLGDAWGGVVKALVKRSRDTITWSEFNGDPESVLPAGPFVFEFQLNQYIEVLAPVCFRSLRSVQKSWPLKDDVLQSTWACEWPALPGEMERFPRPEPAIRSWPRGWERLPGLKLGRPWWQFW
jgi:hypothetical protein